MRLRGLLGLLGVWFGLAALPVRAQRVPVRFRPPVSDHTIANTYAVTWDDIPSGALDPGNLTSLTWYYSTKRDGTDLHRLVTRPGYRDDFNNFLSRWNPQGAFGFDWKLRQDPRSKVTYLAGSANAAPLVSFEAPPVQDCVVSVLLRPQAISRDAFGFQTRVQPGRRGAAFEIRFEGGFLKVFENGNLLCQGRNNVLMSPTQWYWCEMGLVTRKSKDVEIRVRVFDENRQKVVGSFSYIYRPQARGLLGPGTVALFGPADFQQLYIEPWTARWADDPRNELTWDATDVPSGEYYLVAEVAGEKGQPNLVFSDYKVTVRNPTQAFSK